MKKQIDPLSFFNSVITDDFIEELLEAEAVVHREGIFKAVIVIWLMISQRLNPSQSLARAVKELRLVSLEPLLGRASGSIRARGKRVSSSTGGYSQARDRISLAVVEGVADKLCDVIEKTSRNSSSARQVYVIDGSTVRISHSKRNLEAFPSTHNQFGSAHFPIVRIGIAMDAKTGLAVRPSLGPYNGPEAVGELDLAAELLNRLPKGSTVIGDRYYGCFRFANQAVEHGLEVLIRLKELNSKRFIGMPSTASGEKYISWEASPTERSKHPELPVGASVKGKIVWFNIAPKGMRPQRLVLFSTLDLSPKQLAELYGLRWNIELDLRDIKKTLGLEFIRSRTPQMVNKELVLAVAAFNLIRFCMHTVAEALKVDPRLLSFTRVREHMELLYVILLSDYPEETKQKGLTQAFSSFDGLLLYKRKKKRPTEPRKVWPRGDKIYFKSSGSRKQERDDIKKQRKMTNGKVIK